MSPPENALILRARLREVNSLFEVFRSFDGSRYEIPNRAGFGRL